MTEDIYRFETVQKESKNGPHVPESHDLHGFTFGLGCCTGKLSYFRSFGAPGTAVQCLAPSEKGTGCDIRNPHQDPAHVWKICSKFPGEQCCQRERIYDTEPRCRDSFSS